MARGKVVCGWGSAMHLFVKRASCLPKANFHSPILQAREAHHWIVGRRYKKQAAVELPFDSSNKLRLRRLQRIKPQ